MAKPKGGLGRGLGALIPAITTSSYIVDVPVDAVLPNPMQPRFRIDSDSLNELAASIREHGVLQPLVVTELPAELSEEPLGFQVPASRYQLIAGERRLEASKLAGRPTVPVIVKEASPQESLEWALIENVQRADLNALEEATAYRHLIDLFSLTQEQVAEQVGKSRFTVANCLRLLNLPEEAKGIWPTERSVRDTPAPCWRWMTRCCCCGPSTWWWPRACPCGRRRNSPAGC
jgi:ParB family transcriptional regulator, chromosome partitioning protein